MGVRPLPTGRLDLLDLVGFLFGDQHSHEIAGGCAFLAENCLLAGVELFPGGDTDRVDHIVVDVPRQREMFLHFVKLAEIDYRNRIFLAIDDLLRQRQIELGKGDRLYRRADRFQRRLNLQLGWRAQLESLDVVGRVYRTYGIGYVAEAVLPIVQQNEALPFRERRQPIHARTVEHAVHVLRTVPDERQHDGGRGLFRFGGVFLLREAHVDGSELYLLRLLGRAAEHVIGEDVDLD